MKLKLFFFSIFSLIAVAGFGQQHKPIPRKSALAKKKADTVIWDYKPNFMVGVDVLHLGLSAFGDQKVVQGFISTRFREKVHLIADVGFDKNLYDKYGYDVTANGFYVKAGMLYMMAPDPENAQNGFYVGGKVAASLYNQELKSVPIRWLGGNDSFASFPSSSQSAYWIEAALGGRIEILGSNFYIDAQVQPKYLIYGTKQEGVTPMVIPGFGKDSGKFKLGFSWSLAYKF